MKIVVVGCGDWGKNIARTLDSLGSLYAICDHHHSQHALDYAKQLSVPLKNFQECIDDQKVDGVVISTQTASHYELATKALEANKHVFVEKPLVPSMEEATHLKTLAQEKNRVLMVGHLLRYHLAFERLQQWTQDKKLGTILHMNTSRKNLGKIYPNESVIWDLAPHDLSMILAILGNKVTRVLATSGNYAVPIHADEAMISLKFESGQHAFITLSRLSPFKEQKVTIVGTEGMAIFDDTLPIDQKLTFHQNRIVQKSLEQFEIERDPEGTHEPLTNSEPLKNEMGHFLDCIKSGNPPRTPAREAMDILRIIVAAHESIKSGQWVNL